MTDTTTTETQAAPQAAPTESADARRDRLQIEFAERLERADAKLTQARDAERLAKDKERRAGLKFEEALANWQRAFPPRTLADELKAQQQIDIDRRSNGYRPPQSAVGPSNLDHVLAAGRGGSIESGSGRRPRGGTGKQFKGAMVPQPKLPSQR